MPIKQIAHNLAKRFLKTINRSPFDNKVSFRFSAPTENSPFFTYFAANPLNPNLPGTDIAVEFDYQSNLIHLKTKHNSADNIVEHNQTYILINYTPMVELSFPDSLEEAYPDPTRPPTSITT